MIHRLVALLACLALGGCSFLLDVASPTQCGTDADCDSQSGLEGRACSAGYCVTRPPSGVSTDAGPGCVDTPTCTNANSNQAAVCKTRGEPCVAWQIEQCPFISGAWQDPNAIVVGTILPLTVKQYSGERPAGPYAEGVRNALDFALTEWQAKVPEGIRIGSDIHPLAMLHCDSAFDEKQAQAVFDHLTNVVGVQGMIVGTDEELGWIAAQATAKTTAIACIDCGDTLPNGPLAWSMVPPFADQAAMAARHVSDFEAQILARPSAPTKIKVSLFVEPQRLDTAFSNAFLQSVRFNGKSAADNGADFQIVTSELPEQARTPPLTFPDQVVQLCPDIVVSAVAEDWAESYLPEIESTWGNRCSNPKPMYVTSEDGRSIPQDWTTLFTSTAFADLPKRLRGTRTYQSADLAAATAGYEARYRAWPESNFKAPASNGQAYDAFYALAYAIYAASPTAVLDGPHISSGFESLVTGLPIDVGPAALQSGVGQLFARAKINLHGVYSSLGWDVSTRRIASDVGSWCFRRDASNHVVALDDAGIRYTPATQTFTGTYACPDLTP